ncbi:MAG TPA: hypothetical protein ENJ00_08735 [Phycisphaerales bacterium]|nr:hypothetical protein [Phycisphaerales bacterium]
MSTAATSRPNLGFGGRPAEAKKPGIRQRISMGLIGLATSAVVWVFALGTASRCAMFAKQAWDGGMGEFLHASMGQLSFSAFGLHYEGQWGALLAGGQGLAVILGLAMTLASSAMVRRLGSMVLMAWAGLWVAGSVSLAMEVPEPEIVLMSAATGVVFLCTLIRSARLWANRQKKGKGAR